MRSDEAKSMNIFQRLLAIQTETPTVSKNLEVKTSKTGGYKAVSERDVKDAVKPLEDKYGIYSYPISKELIESDFLTSKTEYGERKSFWIREKVTYRFVNVDNPNEFIEVCGYGDGIDTGDKATGKADTYAGKYCIMSAYKISTGDDPDAKPSESYEGPADEEKATPKQIAELMELLTPERFAAMLTAYKVNDAADLPKKEATKIIRKLKA